MSAQQFHLALLRPAVLHILRAAGFHAARPAALDTMVDLTARYMLLLAKAAAKHAQFNHEGPAPTITDVRMAMQDVDVLTVHLSPLEESLQGQEDVQSVEAFIDWVKGDSNKEIRRIAGTLPVQGEGVDLVIGEERGDFLTVLKHRYNKGGDDSKFQGTVLGKPAEKKAIAIEGSSAGSIAAWEESAKLLGQPSPSRSASPESVPSLPSSAVSSPLSEI